MSIRDELDTLILIAQKNNEYIDRFKLFRHEFDELVNYLEVYKHIPSKSILRYYKGIRIEVIDESIV